MLVVKRPTAVVFGWDKEPGKYEFISDVYSTKENLMGWVDLFCLSGEYRKTDVLDLMFQYKADLVVCIGNQTNESRSSFEDRLHIFYQDYPSDIQIANDVVTKTVENNCVGYVPEFSIFTPAYKTGERILRTYESLSKQTFSDWEWVVVDDSPADHVDLWNRLNEISGKDFRVKPYRISPNSSGVVGKVKNRACSLSSGKWLVELDHDDALTSDCLSTLSQASKTFPDAGFIYSDCTEVESNGEFRKYDDRVDWDFYGDHSNFFNFGYSGHSWVNVDGKSVLRHHTPSINPVTIRFNVSMPNHVRCWRRDVYFKIGGHNENLPIADDLDLIIRTFLETRIIHVGKVLYFQYNNGRSTVDLNSFEINRVSRIIKNLYDKRIHQRIEELGFHDWDWDPELQCSRHQEAWVLYDHSDVKFGEEEQVLNYIFEK
jgi:glycosyltransferase involved in cell wall biosynthesis